MAPCRGEVRDQVHKGEAARTHDGMGFGFLDPNKSKLRREEDEEATDLDEDRADPCT